MAQILLQPRGLQTIQYTYISRTEPKSGFIITESSFRIKRTHAVRIYRNPYIPGASHHGVWLFGESAGTRMLAAGLFEDCDGEYPGMSTTACHGSAHFVLGLRTVDDLPVP